jgi:signal-transduction protein with cAMP-binding, CBS, and nucleotidyltransferase domain
VVAGALPREAARARAGLPRGRPVGLSPEPAEPAEIAAFLAGHPPFSGLDPAALHEVAAAATVRAYRPGEAALVEDGAPAHALYVVRSGAMELVHADQVVDVLEPGQCFGHPSLLTELAPTFTVRAREPATCLLLPREAAMRVFAQPPGARYLASSLRSRLVRTGHTAHALPELSMTRLGALVDRPPVFVSADASPPRTGGSSACYPSRTSPAASTRRSRCAARSPGRRTRTRSWRP